MSRRHVFTGASSSPGTFLGVVQFVIPILDVKNRISSFLAISILCSRPRRALILSCEVSRVTSQGYDGHRIGMQ